MAIRQIEDRMVLRNFFTAGDGTILDTSVRKLQANSDAVATTTEPTYVVSYADTNGSTLTLATNVGSLSGTTFVDLIGAPASGSQRAISEINIYNADTVQHTITVRLLDNSTPYILGAFAVPAAKTLRYTPEEGWQVGETGNGTVTSVGLSLPSELTVSGSPVTTSGTLAAVWANQSANLVLAGPGSGAAAAPTFRALVAADLPGGFNGFADPTASVGLSAVNGSAVTAMRSDAAPALSQSITPTWTGIHTHSALVRFGSADTTTPLLWGANNTATLPAGGTQLCRIHNLSDTTDTTTSLDGVNIRTDFSGSGGGNVLNALTGNAFNAGSGAVGTVSGLNFTARNSSNGSVTNVQGVVLGVFNTGGGAVTTSRSLRVLAPSAGGGGTITTNFGIQIQAQTASGITTSWALGSDGTSDNSYFAGTLSVGKSTAATTKLDARVSDAVTAAITDVSSLEHDTSGTAAANFGVGQTWRIENASGTVVLAGRAAVRWLTATAGSEDSEYVISTMQAGTLAEKVRVTPRGYVVSPGNTRVTSDFTKTTDTTLADATGLSVKVAAGKTYHFRAWLPFAADATGGHKYAVAGTATATDIRYTITSRSDATALVMTSTQTALAGAAGQAGATAGETIIEGTITVNAAGTLTTQFAQNASSGSSSIKRGATFIVTEID